MKPISKAMNTSELVIVQQRHQIGVNGELHELLASMTSLFEGNLEVKLMTPRRNG